MEYLLDTNVIINFLEASLPEKAMSEMKIIVDNRPQVSVITKMETLGFNFLSAFANIPRWSERPPATYNQSAYAYHDGLTGPCCKTGWEPRQ